MQKTEWPDAEKLRDLRSQGVFPYSRLATHSGVSLLLLTLLYLMGSKFEGLIDTIISALEQPATNIAAVKISAPAIAKQTAEIFIITGSSIAAGLLLFILIQSKFFFSLISMAPGPKRVRRQPPVFSGFLLTMLRGVFGVLLGTGVAGLLFYGAAPELMTILFSDDFFRGTTLHPRLLQSAIQTLLAMSIMALFILAALSYLLVRFGFLYRHRTKAGGPD